MSKKNTIDVVPYQYPPGHHRWAGGPAVPVVRGPRSGTFSYGRPVRNPPVTSGEVVPEHQASKDPWGDDT